MPKSREDFERKILDMEDLWQFLCCWVALGGCHIRIKCPPGGLETCKEDHNFKNSYSVVLMAMIDSHYRFLLHVTREFHSIKLICRNLYAKFSHVKKSLYSHSEWRTAVFTCGSITNKR